MFIHWHTDRATLLSDGSTYRLPDPPRRIGTEAEPTLWLKSLDRLEQAQISFSTEAKDRGVKFACYQELDSVQEYVIISTTKQSVEVYRRDDEDSDGNRWNYQRYTAGDIVRFECIDVEVKIEDLYRRTKVSPA